MRKYLNIKETNSATIKNHELIETPESDYFKLPENWKFIPDTLREAPFEIVSFREFTKEEKEKQIKDLQENSIFYSAIWGEINV